MNAITFYISESCMQPNGAYAKTLAYFDDEASARAAFKTAFFSGPVSGIVERPELSLRKRVGSQRVLVEQRYI